MFLKHDSRNKVNNRMNMMLMASLGGDPAIENNL